LKRYQHSQFSERDLEARKRTVGVLIPAHNEASRIRNVVEPTVELLHRELIDQVVVVADRCTDDTEQIAQSIGAEVRRSGDLFPELGPVENRNKGDVLWRGIHGAMRTDLTVMVDADSGPEFGSHFIVGLAGALLAGARFVKATYERPLDQALLAQGISSLKQALGVGSGELPRRRGRVNSFTAHPLLALLWPEISGFEQVLSGEMGAETDLLRSIPLEQSYGVEVAMVIDLFKALGSTDAMAEVDLGRRKNKSQSDAAYERMALAVARAVLSRTPPDRLAAVMQGDTRPPTPHRG
jgi:glucosyl-3-phosphoglycerate synthase